MTAREMLLAKAVTEIKQQVAEHKPGCLIIHGEIGSGKTQFAQNLVTTLTKQQIEVGGIVSPRILQEGETVGYKVRDVKTAKEKLLATLNPPGVKIGRFYLSKQALDFAHTALIWGASSAQVVVVDEVGRLELKEQGHAAGLRIILQSGAVICLCVRTAFVKAVTETFQVKNHLALHVTNKGNVI